jgi:uncharacterized membrane protein YraQ (UPF0718 family)
MIISISILFIFTAVLLVIAYRRGDDTHVRGLRAGRRMLTGVIPLLLLAFVVAGLIQVAIPPEIFRSWLSEEAGWKGIFSGTVVGMLIPGGPYITFPIIAAIFHAGAGIGTTVSIITGWAMLGVGQISFELALIGPRFMAVRLCTVFIIPPLAGVAAQYFFGGGF